MKLWRWLIGQSHDLGRLSDAWLANTERLAAYVAWNEREASGRVEAHAYCPDTYGAAERARREMAEERHASYLERTT
jgi:hypothetical protein